MSDGNEILYPLVSRSIASRLLCSDASRTVQADLEDSDINVLMRRFRVTGSMPVGVRIPEYADYEGVFDYQSAQNALVDARTNFMAIPAEIRAKFDNDPGKFLSFAADPGNIDALRDLGLAVPKPVVERVDSKPTE